MYARNNASPRPITIGAVVQISDGAVQTSDVSVKVRKDSGSWATGAGTLAVEEGVWSYTPTQGETDCDALQIIIFKTSCIPNSMEVVFTSSASFGHAGTDQSKIANPTSTVNLSGTTIKTATDVEADTQDIQGRLPASLDAGRIVATVGAYQSGNAPLQPTVSGRTLDVTATGAAGIDWGNVENQGATVNLAATMVYVVDSVNSASLADPIGQIWEVLTSGLTVNGTIGKLLADNVNATISSRATQTSVDAIPTTPAPTAGAVADAVWDEAYSQHTTAGSFGKLMDIIRKANTVIEGTVTSAATPATTSFSSSVSYPTGAFKHTVLLFLDGNLAEQNSPILTYTNANGVITVEEAFTQAPQVGDNFIIIPTTHVHAVAAISSAVWSDASADDAIRAAVGLATANLDSQLAAALVLQKLAASGATGSVQVTDNGNGTATLVFKDTNGSTTLATVTYNYTSGARTRVS